MFSYVDPSIKQDLIRNHKLVFVDELGQECDASCPDQSFLSLIGPVPLPLRVGDRAMQFKWYAAVRHSDLHRIEGVVEAVRSEGPRMLFALLADHMAVNSALVLGDFAASRCPTVRVHSNCLTGDVFGSMRCECGPQLQAALETVCAEGVGAVVYMAGHEGRGIGLWAKAITYLLQDAGQDTYEANERLGLPADSRDFKDAARIIVYLRGGKKPIRLLGNNPLKRKDLEELGLPIAEQRPLVVGVTNHNLRYMDSKRVHGHIIPEQALRAPTTPRVKE